MKKIATVFLLFLLYSFSSSAQPVDRAEKLKPPPTELEKPETQAGIEAVKPPMDEETASGQIAGGARSPMDGFTLLMGAYSPLNDEMKGIYGGIFALSGMYCLNMGGSTDLLASIGLMRKDGNPYYNVPTFSSGKSSKIQIIPLEFSLRYRLTLMKSPDGLVSRGLYGGAGINYIRAKEEIPGLLMAKGGDFGMQMFAGPQMFITENLAFEGEVKLLLSNVDMKYKDDRYSLTLSGLIIRAALSWYY